MKALTCSATRRKLEAFHDGELSVCDQIDVDAHLEWCSECARAVAELRTVSAVLRAAQGRQPWSNEEYAVFTAGVVNRLSAEYDQSWFVRGRDLFADMHLVYAGVGAAVATLACVIIVLGMMRFATNERPDSLAAIVNILANPGSNAYPAVIDARIQMPRALDPAFSAPSAQEDAVFTLAAVITREGTITNPKMVRASGRAGAAQAKAVETLMNAMSRSRFEPAQMAGLPVAVNMVWMVANTTVRAKHPIA